jgi:hypothetical protein
VIPHDAVVIALSGEFRGELQPEGTISSVVTAFPDSEYYFVFSNDESQDDVEPFVDSILEGRIPQRAVASLRDLIAALEMRSADKTAEPSRVRVGQVAKDMRNRAPNGSDELFVTFDPSLSAEQIQRTLTALAQYYRACGGVGLPADFESQEAPVLEDLHV